jgi:hypothetical protein
MAMTLDGSNGVTFNDASLQGAAASPYVLKNRIINGAMVIDQRNAGASVALSGSSKFPVDRFIGFYTNTGGAATAQQSSVAPAGFNNSFLYSVTTGAAIGTGDYSCIQQNIEGYNVADLDFGSATAKTITLSFWVRSSLTGTFSGSLQNSAANRSYVYTYTISAANTWEQKTITIAGDTTGTWLKTNGSGLLVYWNMGFQSASLTSTTNTWVAGAFNGVTGGVTPSTTTGATFYITGVQLEVGTTATPFERRLYNQELANCQRYYEKSYNVSVAPGTAGSGLGAISAVAYTAASNRPFLGIQFQVAKRANTTITLYSPNSGVAGKIEGPSSADFTASVQYAGTQAFQVYQSQTTSTSNGDYYIQWTASAEL